MLFEPEEFSVDVDLLHFGLIFEDLYDLVNGFLNIKYSNILCEIILLAFENRIVQNIMNKKIYYLSRIRDTAACILNFKERIIEDIPQLFYYS